MGIASSYGACALAGVFFGPMNNCLPFLLLGIGIDDMFVIVQCWDNLQQEEEEEREEDEVSANLISRFALTKTF